MRFRNLQEKLEKWFNLKMIPSGKFMDKRSNLSTVLQLIKGDFICIVLVFELFSPSITDRVPHKRGSDGDDLSSIW